MSDDQEKREIPEMTPEQKAAMETVKNSVSKFNQVVSFYLFNQFQMIDDGEIHIHLTIKNRQIDDIELHSRMSRKMINGKKD